jgi:hypothetical protein
MIIAQIPEPVFLADGTDFFRNGFRAAGIHINQVIGTGRLLDEIVQ